MKTSIKKYLITLILITKITRIKNINSTQKNRNLITCYDTCNDCYGENYNNCESCKYSFMTISLYDTCDCENSVLYTDTSCIDNIKCAQNYKVTKTGLCSTTEGESCTNEQILYKCFDVNSNDFPDLMIELIIKEIRFFNSHDSYTYNDIIYYSFEYDEPGKKSDDLIFFDLGIYKEQILEDFLIDSFNVIVKQEKIDGYTDTISFYLTYPFPINQIIEISDKQYVILFEVPLNEDYIEESYMKIIEQFLSNGIDILNIRDNFYQDVCSNTFYNGVDMDIKSKINEFYKYGDLCSNHTNNCVYSQIKNEEDGYKIVCSCNYNGLLKEPSYDSSSIQKIVNLQIFKCFTLSDMNIGLILSLLILISLILISIIFCCCEVHYTKSLIYRTVPSNPKKSETNDSIIINDNEKKDDKVTTNNNEENKENNENNNEENDNENEEKKDEEEKKEEEKKDEVPINYKEKDFEVYQTDMVNYGKFGYFFKRKLFQQIEIIQIIYYHEKHMSYCLDVSFFLFSILFDFFITCLLYGDSKVHSQYKKGKSLDFINIILNGIIGVIVSRIICYFIRLLIIYNPTLIDVITDCPYHTLRGIKIVGDFMFFYYIRITIYFILQFVLSFISFIYLTAFFYRYKKISTNALFSFIVGGIFIIIFSIIVSLIYALFKNKAYKKMNKTKEERKKKLEDEIEIKNEEEEIEEEEEVEEEKEFEPKVNANNGEELEIKSNLPPRKKTVKIVDENEDKI